MSCFNCNTCRNRCGCRCAGCGIVGATGPVGPQGAQGPQGEPGTSAAGIGAYGGCYHNVSEVISSMTPGIYVQKAFDTALPAKGVTFANNTLTVETAGDYEVYYNLVVSGTAPAANFSVGDTIANLVTTVRKNGTGLNATRGMVSLTDTSSGASLDTRYTVTTIVSLAAGDTLDVALTVPGTIPSGFTARLGYHANAMFTLKKLSAE